MFGFFLVDRASLQLFAKDALPDFPVLVILSATPLLHWAWHIRHEWEDFPDEARPESRMRLLGAFLLAILGPPLGAWLLTAPLCLLSFIKDYCSLLEELLIVGTAVAVILKARRIVWTVLPD